jgi:soluble lytic murein transglycosylase-like protein
MNVFIDRFGGQYGVSPDVLRYIALCESGFDPFAKKLSYVGLFQFGPSTWQNIRSEIGEDKDISLRANAEEAVQTAAYAISIGKKGIWPNCYP